MARRTTCWAVEGLEPQLALRRPQRGGSHRHWLLPPLHRHGLLSAHAPSLPVLGPRADAESSGCTCPEPPTRSPRPSPTPELRPAGRDRSDRTGGYHRPAGSVALLIGNPWSEIIGLVQLGHKKFTKRSNFQAAISCA